MPKLIDEFATNQERQLAVLNADLSTADDLDQDDEPTWGSDPFDILAALEEERGYPISHH